MSEPGSGRAKGRSRGRAKPVAQATVSRPAGPGSQSLPPRGQTSQVPPGFPSVSSARPDVEAVAAGLSRVRIDPGNGSIGRGAVRGRREISEVVLRTRPSNVNSKKGVSGRAVKLTANYFKLESHTDWCLFQYRVDFAPEEDRTMVRKGLLKNHKDTLGGYIFDGTVLYTSHRLHPEPMELFSKRTTDDENIRISIRMVGDLAEGDAHYIQVFNILMRMSLGHLNLQLVGRDFFDALAKIEVKQYKLELWPGYITSIRQHERDIMMCSEIVHKIMRQDTALEALNESLQKDSKNYKQDYQAKIVGSTVLTDYNNHTYRIDDVDFKVSPRSTFDKRNGEPISYISYYKSKYGIIIRNEDQPLLISRAKPRERRAGQSELVYLVPELCRCTGMTDDMRGNFQLMKALADHTRVGPGARIAKLNAFNQRLLNTKEVMAMFKEWNLGLSQTLVEFDGRVLQEEQIVLGGQKKVGAGPQTDWTKDLRSNPMLTIATLTNWVVIVPDRFSREAQTFIQTLERSSAGMRFKMPAPYIHQIRDDRAGTYVEALEQVISSKNPRLIMCIVSNNRSDRYSAIKKKCCVDRAVPTQVMVAKNLSSKGVMSIATKVAIQMNCKIGGAPWTVEVPLTGLMIAGFDVCHDTASKGKSYGALVCSLDKSFTRYFSAVSSHSSGEELSNDLSVNMAKALHKYQEYNNGALPQRIVVYRDGVGEGQISYVFQHEVVLLKDNLAKMYGQMQCKLAFIIVTKRINTRLFLNDNNPLPGTVADDCVTMPEKYDFYLVSQSVRQGTVSPTAYNIIDDNVGLDPDKIQRLTYKLTHMYFNWSGTVRVPAPTQYAHKLAFLVGQFLHRPPNAQLEDSLYFL